MHAPLRDDHFDYLPHPQVGGLRYPTAILVQSDYYGTLAAARCLGERGIPVEAADSHHLAVARWSRYVRKGHSCPSLDGQPEQFLEWLLAFGARNPGSVLLATSDESAWLYSKYRESLARHFILDCPPFECIRVILNKWRLYNACLSVGLEVPRTWVPRDRADISQIAREAHFPLVVKPQTQVMMSVHKKGEVIQNAADLTRVYDSFLASIHYDSTLSDAEPGVSEMMLQEYHHDTNGVYSLSGFIDASGDLYVVTASRKLLQRPLFTGVGLCFEAAEVIPALADRLHALLRRLGYHGVFEVEFLQTSGGNLLIDFNPRFFGQMGFDIARGVALPALSYLAAIGDRQELASQIRHAKLAASRTPKGAYVNRIQLEIYLRLLRLGGHITHGEAERWREWLACHCCTDAVIRADDWIPTAVEIANTFVRHAAHPRSAIRCH